MPLETSTHLDRHEILAPLGKGGMGEVYLVRRDIMLLENLR